MAVSARFPLDREAPEHIDNKTDAVALAERLRTLIRNGTFRQPPPAVIPNDEPITLETYARQEWLPAATQNLKASTVRFYSDNLENNIVPLLGSRPIDQIARKDCRELVIAARSKGLKIATVRGVVRTLSAILSQAVEDEHLPANPALSMRKYLRRGDEPETPMDPFTKEEVAVSSARRENTSQRGIPGYSVVCGLECEPANYWRCNGATSIGAVGIPSCNGISFVAR